MRRIQVICQTAIVATVVLGVCSVSTALAQGVHEGAAAAGGVGAALAGGAPYYAVALTMGIACLSAAYAVGKVGAAALGAAAEKPELLGKAIVFVGLGEGIAIFGLIISLMLVNKL